MARTALHPLRIRRLEAGETQADLARALRVSVATIQNIERFRSSGQLKTRLRAAEHYGCSLAEITDPREAD